MSEISKVKSWKIFLPVFLGLLVIAYMFWKEFNPAAFSKIGVTWFSVFWIIVAFLCIAGRDLGYIVRIKVLSEGQLSWRQAFRVIMLWEFTSAITPGSVGGTSVALMYVHKEGISLGKSSSIVMVTSLLDELYFVFAFPVVMFVAGVTELFEIKDSEGWSGGLFWLAVIAYTIKLIWVLFMIYGLFVNPKRFSRMIYRLLQLPFLKKRKRRIARVVHDMESSSAELKNKKISFWLKAFLSTIVSWTSRYWVVNCLFLAFFTQGFDQFMVFARQLVMWLILLVSPTPGGSGIAEYMFDLYLGEYVDMADLTGFTIVLVLLWRLITYYPYLIVGTVMVPKWISDNFVSRKK
jgi:uncharacterized protein (TIRG00374 family)